MTIHLDVVTPADQPPARLVAGALAHLARHMETGCTRSAYLAAMLLEKIANDPEADDHLRRHARELADIIELTDLLEREDKPAAAARGAPAAQPSPARLNGIFMGTF
ncbi:MAG: hypothetical protein KGZ43_02110 [Sulfuritalea sp.]|nr:hypothetical protein [Sulfuritalea sp.]